jgi:hypothetical protein
MCTQGWRRYNITEMALGRYSRPSYPLEMGSEVSGTVKSVLLNTPVAGVDVTALSLNNNYFNFSRTDKEGRFWLSGGEIADSTRLVIGVEEKKGMTRMNLILDPETFPLRTLRAAPLFQIDKKQFAQYADIAERQYINEGGIRMVQLPDAVVTAQRIPPKKSLYYSEPSHSITEEELDRTPVSTIWNLFSRLPGVEVREWEEIILMRGLTTINGKGIPLIMLNDVPMDIRNLNKINVSDIAQIDVLKTIGSTAVYGSGGGNGVISIFLKDGSSGGKYTSEPSHIRTFLPLGYQQPVEFYAPIYDTPEKQSVFAPDLRTTIHWQPIVQTDAFGIASFEFYTADEATSYTVIIEGLANDGTIIRHKDKVR